MDTLRIKRHTTDALIFSFQDENGNTFDLSSYDRAKFTMAASAVDTEFPVIRDTDSDATTLIEFVTASSTVKVFITEAEWELILEDQYVADITVSRLSPAAEYSSRLFIIEVEPRLSI